MANIPFPQIQPSGRTYSPGRLPETRFQAQNGATTFVQFGNTFVNAELSLEFRNISDSEAGEILDHYHSVKEDDNVSFGADRAFGGYNDAFREKLENGRSTLRWRYDGPPSIVSVYPGVSSVSCQFIGYFFGA